MKKKKWMKFRHKVVFAILRWPLHLYCKWKYGLKAEKFSEQGNRAYLVLMNHQTAFDQFFVALSFKNPMYFVASEDLFSKGWVSSLIRWLVAPIPIKKQTTDVSAVINCIRLAKEGATITMAPEGNRTYSGKTEYMNPAVAALAKKLKLPIALYRIEGGFGVHPRWSDKLRKGKVHSYVSRVIEPEEYAKLTNEELLTIIEDGLFVDEGNSDNIFKSSNRAEYLERAMYVCPFCGLSEFESNGNITECKKCHRRIEYMEDTSLRGVDFTFPFSFMTEWYEHQKDFVLNLDLTEYTENPIYIDKADVLKVIVYKKKVPICESAEILLYGDKIIIKTDDDNLYFNFSDTSAVTVLGRNKLNIYYDNEIYQLKGDKRFNALKYVNFFYRFNNIIRGERNGKFLGI